MKPLCVQYELGIRTLLAIGRERAGWMAAVRLVPVRWLAGTGREWHAREG